METRPIVSGPRTVRFLLCGSADGCAGGEMRLCRWHRLLRLSLGADRGSAAPTRVPVCVQRPARLQRRGPVVRPSRPGPCAGRTWTSDAHVCVCRVAQKRAFHASAARRFDFSKFSDAVTSNEARLEVDSLRSMYFDMKTKQAAESKKSASVVSSFCLFR